MSAQIETTCPTCGKVLKVPEAALGKMIRCKACDTTFKVAEPGVAPKPTAAKPTAAKPTVAKPAVAKATVAKPTTAKPAVAKAKPPAPKVEDAPPADGLLGFAKDDDDDEDNPKPFGVVIEGEEARCPLCAKELDPPDTKVCLNCGFDLVVRRRHASKKIYEQTQGDYFNHWWPAVLWAFMIIMVIVVFVICWIKMDGWFEGSLFEKDDKNSATNRAEYYLPPGACNMCCLVLSVPIIANGIRVILKRIKNPKPPEIERRDE